jgi:hypothetical protein
MLPIISLGPLTLPVPYFVLLLGIWLGSILADNQAKTNGQDAEKLDGIIWGSIFAGLLGARVSFIARNIGAFSGQWGSIFSLNPALLDPVGGFLIGGVVGYFLAVRFNQADRSLLDKLVPFAAVLTPAIFLSNFAAGAGYGSITDVPWGIDLWGGIRHPVQIYYLGSSLLVLYWSIKYSKVIKLQEGSRMLLFIIFTAGYITIFSAFQDPGDFVIGRLRGLQLSSWTFMTLALLTYYRLTQTKESNAPS